MSIDIGCAIMIGLPYNELVKQLQIYKEELDDLIHDDEFDISAVHYDSDRESNIVGKFLARTESYKELPEDFISGECSKIANRLRKEYPTVEWKLYLVNNIT